MSNIKKGVLFSVQNEQGVKLYTADVVIGSTTSNNKSQNGAGFEEIITATRGSGDRIIPGSMKPLDISSVPPEQQALARVLAREFEKAKGNGALDSATVTITIEQVDAELRKLRKGKRKMKR
jgi:hypothetical protein